MKEVDELKLDHLSCTPASSLSKALIIRPALEVAHRPPPAYFYYLRQQLSDLSSFVIQFSSPDLLSSYAELMFVYYKLSDEYRIDFSHADAKEDWMYGIGAESPFLGGRDYHIPYSNPDEERFNRMSLWGASLQEGSVEELAASQSSLFTVKTMGGQ